jgi:hypothetical protein
VGRLGGRRAGLRRIGDLHHPRQELLGRLPWKLVFLGNKIDKETAAKTFANFDREYWLADAYLEGGRPKIVKPDPTWLKVWKDKAVDIGIFVTLLLSSRPPTPAATSWCAAPAATTSGR